MKRKSSIIAVILTVCGLVLAGCSGSDTSNTPSTPASTNAMPSTNK